MFIHNTTVYSHVGSLCVVCHGGCASAERGGSHCACGDPAAARLAFNYRAESTFHLTFHLQRCDDLWATTARCGNVCRRFWSALCARQLKRDHPQPFNFNLKTTMVAWDQV